VFTVTGYSNFASYYSKVKSKYNNVDEITHRCLEAMQISDDQQNSDEVDLIENSQSLNINENKWNAADVSQLSDTLRKKVNCYIYGQYVQ
jgi:hypothetical protein